MLKRLNEKKTDNWANFDIAPDFKNGGIYKDIDLETKKFEVITDDLPF
jgi:hypothetical protein